MPKQITREERVQALIDITKEIMKAIKEAKRIPSGHLYAMLMNTGCSIDQYKMLEETMISTGLVKLVNFELVWCGPEDKAETKTNEVNNEKS